MKPPRKLKTVPLVVVFYNQPMWQGDTRVFYDRVDDLPKALGEFEPWSMTIYAGPDYLVSEERDGPAYWQARFFPDYGCKYRGLRVPDENGRDMIFPPLGPGFYQDCMFPEGLNWTDEEHRFSKIRSFRFVEHRFSVFSEYRPPTYLIYEE